MDSSKILLSILWLVLGIALFIVWIWVVRKYILRTGNFTCCRCRKEYPQKHETEKNLCRWCKEKKKNNLCPILINPVKLPLDVNEPLKI